MPFQLDQRQRRSPYYQKRWPVLTPSSAAFPSLVTFLQKIIPLSEKLDLNNLKKQHVRTSPRATTPLFLDRNTSGECTSSSACFRRQTARKTLIKIISESTIVHGTDEINLLCSSQAIYTSSFSNS